MIYVIYAKELNRVKIGYTRDESTLPNRIIALSTGSPTRLEVIKTFSGDREEEKSIHARFSHLRVVNEWFALSRELALYLELSEEFVFAPVKTWGIVQESHGAYVAHYDKITL